MAFEPKTKNRNWIEIQCPLLFHLPELEQICKKDKCAWWLPIQKACAIQVSARGIGL